MVRWLMSIPQDVHVILDCEIHCIVGEIFFYILNAPLGIKTRKKSGEPTKYYTLRQMKGIGHFLTTSVDSTRDRCDFSMITECWPE